MINWNEGVSSVVASFSIGGDTNGGVDELDTLQQTVNAVFVQHKVVTDAKLSEAEIINNSINTADIPLENEKFINQMRSAHQRSGQSSIATNYLSLLAIAQQCPFSGGPSVYTARTFLGLINDSLHYDDATMCLQQGIYRQQIVNKVSQVNEITIVPNPANQTTTVSLNNNYTGICKLRVSDVLGKNVFVHEFNCDEKQYQLSTMLFKPGMYQIVITINNDYIKTGKLVIVR